MRLRDRFFTPRTAKAILSWRILLGVGVAVALAFTPIGVPAAIGVGLLAYAGLVAAAMPRGSKQAQIDPFTLSEPWRQMVQGAQRAGRRLHETVSRTSAGPLRERLDGIVGKLDRALAECWEIARRGDDIDEAVGRLDPTGLRSKLGTLRAQAKAGPSDDLAAAIASVEGQLASADRMKELSTQTADRLRLTQTRLDELVARTAEVSIGASDTAAYASDVDDLVVEIEAMRLAVEETRST
jgi:methyl-accepting chemotaxis protein